VRRTDFARPRTIVDPAHRSFLTDVTKKTARNCDGKAWSIGPKDTKRFSDESDAQTKR